LASPKVLAAYKKEANNTIGKHSLREEKKQFLDIMANLDQIW